jgi:hypothetical protein
MMDGTASVSSLGSSPERRRPRHVEKPSHRVKNPFKDAFKEKPLAEEGEESERNTESAWDYGGATVGFDESHGDDYSQRPYERMPAQQLEELPKDPDPTYFAAKNAQDRLRHSLHRRYGSAAAHVPDALDGLGSYMERDSLMPVDKQAVAIMGVYASDLHDDWGR